MPAGSAIASVSSLAASGYLENRRTTAGLLATTTFAEGLDWCRRHPEALADGGYRLAKGAHETVVAEIVLAVDEPIRATRCVAHGTPKGCMLGGERCITHDLWEDLGDEIHRYLAGVSLEDVVMRRTGARRRAALSADDGAAVGVAA